jgi:hypothetical protein
VHEILPPDMILLAEPTPESGLSLNVLRSILHLPPRSHHHSPFSSPSIASSSSNPLAGLAEGIERAIDSLPRIDPYQFHETVSRIYSWREVLDD